MTAGEGVGSPASWILPATLIGLGAAGLVVTYRIAKNRSRKKIETPTTPEALEALVPDSKFVDVNGARIHYIQAGEGPDVVLLHGIGASVFIWRFVFPLLQVRYRVTAIDLPGFGKSCKEAKRDYGLDAQTEMIAQTLTTLNINEPLIVGSSMGGAISLWLAKLYPERFKKIAALSPATDRSLVPSAVQHFATAAPLLRRALNKRTMRAILGRVLTRRDLITEKVVDAYLEPFLDKGDGVRAFWSATSLLSDRRLPSGLKDLAAKILIIYGERDMMVPRRSIDRLLKLIPNARLLTHSEGGHHIMEDEPQWIADALETYQQE